ncbi:MAG: UDP-N-acetylmuramoyl-L-alanine---L-glutamate ligase [Solirubrobacteraceae bacterium]|nr:UDP-N-acetylmuramoyl-L-alanine---L-glutamate ligase [Solirubrobacteraceae bacterium]
MPSRRASCPTYVRFSELDGRSVGVWGAGREIRSLAAQLARRVPSARIVVVAADEALDPTVVAELGDPRVVRAPEAAAALGACDVVVRSPGVSIYRDELRALRERGVPVTTATGLWLAERGGAGVIGVTGTKGKSTTAGLIHHLARAAGGPAELAGNIGVPALDLLDRPPGELAVVELSSYQIADLEVGPEVVAITNLYPEHTDWHGSDAAYRADKLRILGLPGVRSSVLNARDPALAAAARTAPGPVFYGGPDGWDATPEGISYRGGPPAVRAGELPLRGEHNALNLCAALTALGAAGVEAPPLPAGLAGFAALPHRLEVVADADGVIWVDDSISTTPESTLAALASFADRDVVLLAGGHDRGQDYAALARELAARSAVVIGLPATGGRLVEAARAAGLSGHRTLEAVDLPAAVALARGLAGSGAAVLLSPAAPSYNAYRNFEDRGDHFRSLLEPTLRLGDADRLGP